LERIKNSSGAEGSGLLSQDKKGAGKKQAVESDDEPEPPKKAEKKPAAKDAKPAKFKNIPAAPVKKKKEDEDEFTIQPL